MYHFNEILCFQENSFSVASLLQSFLLEKNDTLHEISFLRLGDALENYIWLVPLIPGLFARDGGYLFSNIVFLDFFEILQFHGSSFPGRLFRVAYLTFEPFPFRSFSTVLCSEIISNRLALT